MTKEEWVEAKIQSVSQEHWYRTALLLAEIAPYHKLTAVEGFAEMLLEEYHNDVYRALEERFEEEYTEYKNPEVYDRIRVGRGDDNLVLEYVDDSTSALDTWRLIDLDTGEVHCKAVCLHTLIHDVACLVGDTEKEYVEEVIFPFGKTKRKVKTKENEQ
jgi:hypothetical protein